LWSHYLKGSPFRGFYNGGVVVSRALSGGLIIGVAALWAQESPLAPETLLLSRVKYEMSKSLTRLPNYTCLQTIERSRRQGSSKKFQLSDVVRLEVALVEGKEMFSWPGARKFEQVEITKMVAGGAIGNGNFALHARSVFASNAPTYKFEGDTEIDGRKAWRYSYIVPQFRSGYTIRSGENSAVVGYRGTFIVEADTLDVRSLEVIAENIPAHIQIRSSKDSMQYARVRIADGDYLLPKGSELHMIGINGDESRNTTRLTGCRQYSGESTLSFGDPDSTPAPAEVPPAVERVELPEGLIVYTTLAAKIETGKSAVGDPVTALVAADVKRKGQLLVPKGARVTGRLARIEKRHGGFEGFWIELRMETIEFGNKSGDFHGRLESAAGLTGYQPVMRGAGQMMVTAEEAPGVGGFLVRGGKVELPVGLRMTWRTQTPR